MANYQQQPKFSFLAETSTRIAQDSLDRCSNRILDTKPSPYLGQAVYPRAQRSLSSPQTLPGSQDAQQSQESTESSQGLTSLLEEVNQIWFTFDQLELEQSQPVKISLTQELALLSCVPQIDLPRQDEQSLTESMIRIFSENLFQNCTAPARPHLQSECVSSEVRSLLLDSSDSDEIESLVFRNSTSRLEGSNLEYQNKVNPLSPFDNQKDCLLAFVRAFALEA